jgi:hypothetical protein
LAVGSIALILYQWLTYRKTTSGALFVFLSLIVAANGLASVWLALNVVRFYTYNPDSEQAWAWHMVVVRIQVALVWGRGAIVVAVFLCALLLFARWLGRRVPHLINALSRPEQITANAMICEVEGPCV